VKLWLEADDGFVLCRGLCAILRAVDETGSIKAAADQVGRSYRFVWAQVKRAEASLGSGLVRTRVGGHGVRRSELTPLARDLLDEFDRLRAEVLRLTDEVFTARLADVLERHGRDA
jgi:molybdate transport system regulatory protein